MISLTWASLVCVCFFFNEVLGVLFFCFLTLETIRARATRARPQWSLNSCKLLQPGNKTGIEMSTPLYWTRARARPRPLSTIGSNPRSLATSSCNNVRPLWLFDASFTVWSIAQHRGDSIAAEVMTDACVSAIIFGAKDKFIHEVAPRRCPPS